MIKFESPTFTCSHCEAVVVMNPDRSRPRGYCKRCDHYICDGCEALRTSGKVCYPYKAVIADMREMADKGACVAQVLTLYAQATSNAGCDHPATSTVPDTVSPIIIP